MVVEAEWTVHKKSEKFTVWRNEAGHFLVTTNLTKEVSRTPISPVGYDNNAEAFQVYRAFQKRIKELKR